MVVLKSKWIAVLVVVLGIGACFLSDATAEPVGPHFSHAIHGEDKGLHCTTCHSGAIVGDAAGLPGPQLCAPCHDRFDADKPPGRRLAAFFDGNGRYQATRAAALSDEVRFSHGKHFGYGVSCSDCHGDTAASDVLPAETAVPKKQCLSCHADAGRADACSDCHTEIDRSWVPPTHAQSWDVFHGQVVVARDPALVNRCDMCHTESSCVACHQENAPRDHTNFWRRRGHGIAVSMDRSRCSTCHRSDQCDRCHQETRPISHTAGFGSSRNRHCVTCHLPVRSEGCATCHKATPSHMLAAPLPPDHNPAMNCRQCHGISAPLPHFDNGDLCTACHR